MNKYNINPKIVAIGGGSGLSVLLKGLKIYSDNITALVTVADDGGGSGVLRREMGILPPGDIRNCLLALSDTEPEMEKLFSHRFKSGSLRGQSFGNLFIAALNEIYGSFEEAVKKSSDILKVKGRVLPITDSDVMLEAIYEDGSRAFGESILPEQSRKLKKKIKRVELYPDKCYPLKEAVEALGEADIIILGPGSLYTSVIPNLLVYGIDECIENSSAMKFYVVNVMTQSGETDGYSIEDHIEAIRRHSLRRLFDTVVINSKIVNNAVLERYDGEGAKQVLLREKDKVYLKSLALSYICEDLTGDHGSFARHDSEKLAAALIECYLKIGRIKKYEK